jgi:integrase
MSSRTKSRKVRISFITEETAGFIHEYLGKRIDSKDEWLFPSDEDPTQHASADALYMDV